MSYRKGLTALAKPAPGFFIAGEGRDSELLRVSGRAIYKHQTESPEYTRAKPAPRDPEQEKFQRLLNRWERSKRFNVSVRRRLQTQSCACLLPAFQLAGWKATEQWWSARGVAL